MGITMDKAILDNLNYFCVMLKLNVAERRGYNWPGRTRLKTEIAGLKLSGTGSVITTAVSLAERRKIHLF
jgi:hypothetical protein